MFGFSVLHSMAHKAGANTHEASAQYVRVIDMYMRLQAMSKGQTPKGNKPVSRTPQPLKAASRPLKVPSSAVSGVTCVQYYNCIIIIITSCTSEVVLHLFVHNT